MPMRLWRMLFQHSPQVAEVVNRRELDKAFDASERSAREARNSGARATAEAEAGKTEARVQRRRTASMAAAVERRAAIMDRLSEEALSEAGARAHR